ncbi:uncharacterized protein PGTG_06182 [Puccinia graminis f. sp. tritici CRL 75-36-700-3]|uniref:CAP-Gly domain-containing protein n=1 Tax=Puccinia graminis f. sp. tritici (strain CRL 75-36-700-3 / race SCCL) TaxID=418459 RepID=E3K820_PUCGT|nr:uncharacterized protein PGTG_06182 [Puccinia graminis f. sp. tritici CRL 75-36-700-3]EFP80226.2 hypothetical protein PGTG_06182 [Puccinia graminis f. sp. tritici CRL 75-36-700-3]
MDSDRYFVGERVILDERHLGTVRFCGPVEGEDQGQTWLGIEWDDPTRGKHSGQFKDGPVLFQPLIPNSGTFMKPSKRLGTGRSFLAALKEKYLDEHLLNANKSNIRTEEDSMRKVALRFSQLDRLRLIGLESSKINRAGNELEIRELEGLLPSVETLNLSSNMFSDLAEVATIAGKLPRLKTLVLSSNRFQFIPEMLSGLFAIEILYLDSTLLTWKQSLKVASQIKALVELSLSNCRIGHFGLDNVPTHEPSFENLSLNSNLSPFNLSSSVQFIVMVLKSVHQLSLVGNLIAEGSEIDNLRDYLPGLSSLFLDGNPLYGAQDVRKNRLLALARYPTLVHLDGSQVTPAERTEADLFYWSIVKKDPADHEQRKKLHKRYAELLAKFGLPEPESNHTRTSALKGKMINLTVVCAGCVSLDREHNIEVLPSMTARGLKIYLAKMIRRSSHSAKSVSEIMATLEVHVADKDNETRHVVDLSDPQKDLGWLGISGGDTLEVSF